MPPIMASYAMKTGIILTLNMAFKTEIGIILTSNMAFKTRMHFQVAGHHEPQ